MTDEVEIQIVDGDEDDPFVQKIDPLASADASTGAEEEDGQDAADAGQSAVTGQEDDADAEFTPAELVALEELAAWQEEQRTAAAAAATSQLQSRYDRQFATQQRQLRQMQEQADTERRTLQEAVREAKLNGLTDAEKEQLKSQWDQADKVAALDAYRDQLTDMHVELLRTAYVTEYATYGLQAGDLDTFETPEEMEAFVKDVQIEYYKLMSDPAVQAALAEGASAAPAATPAPAAAAARKAPAGVNAPTDAGGGGAPPPATKFNSGRGVEAMADNIRGGWESPRVR
jgi:hypothetical protein